MREPEACAWTRRDIPQRILTPDNSIFYPVLSEPAPSVKPRVRGAGSGTVQLDAARTEMYVLKAQEVAARNQQLLPQLVTHVRSTNPLIGRIRQRQRRRRGAGVPKHREVAVAYLRAHMTAFSISTLAHVTRQPVQRPKVTKNGSTVSGKKRKKVAAQLLTPDAATTAAQSSIGNNSLVRGLCATCIQPRASLHG